MKIKAVITSLKVEKGCVNIDCNYCVENKKCYLQQLIEENARLKKTLQELEDLSLKTYDVADFQMYFDNLRGKNND